MTYESVYRGIEFASEKKDQSELQAWYDNLPESEVKAAIIQVRCREFRPHEQASLRIIVLCDHRFLFAMHGVSDGVHCEHEALIARRLSAALPAFADWIDRHNMPEEAVLGDHRAWVDWWPREMLPHILSDLTPHVQAQKEMDNHLLDCLELVRLATLPDQEFALLWHDSNEPFFAAGRLVLGDFQWIREVPAGCFNNLAHREILLDRIGEYSREYVGLMRLASLAGAESPLLEQIWSIIQQFKVKNSQDIGGWQALGRDLIDETRGMPHHPSVTFSGQYVEIDAACDRLRQDLVEVSLGQEDEILVLINAILPTLPAPKSSLHFTDKAEY